MIDYEVVGKMFKITITRDCIMRVKVPEDTTLADVTLWNNRCNEILKYFMENPYKVTLRAMTKQIEGNLVLRVNNNTKEPVFKVVGTEVKEINGKQ